MTVPPQKHKFHLLDALRGIAAALVVGRHVPEIFNRRFVIPGSYLCVDLFFCLSGFVIAYSYQEKLAQKMSFSHFTKIRLIRLYPLYLVGLAVGASFKLFGIALTLSGKQSVYPRPGLLSHFFSALLFALFYLPNPFLSRVAASSFSFNPPSWSLFFELVASIGFGALVRCKMATNAVLAGLMTACFALMFYRTILHTAALDNGFVSGTYSIGFARVGFSFLAGVLIFRVFRAGFRIHLASYSVLPVAALIMAAAAILLSLPISPALQNIYGLVVIGLVFPAIVFVGSCCNLPDGLKSPAGLLGEFSYPLYVIQMPLFFFLVVALKSKHSLVSNPLAAPLLILGLIALSIWLARVYDAPVRRRLTVWLTMPGGKVPAETHPVAAIDLSRASG